MSEINRLTELEVSLNVTSAARKIHQQRERETKRKNVRLVCAICVATDVLYFEIRKQIKFDRKSGKMG